MIDSQHVCFQLTGLSFGHTQVKEHFLDCQIVSRLDGSAIFCNPEKSVENGSESLRSIYSSSCPDDSDCNKLWTGMHACCRRL